MSRYTYRDRQKSLATRRRNARLRRQNDPPSEISKGVVVTHGVKTRLTRQAYAKVPMRGLLWWFDSGWGILLYYVPALVIAILLFGQGLWGVFLGILILLAPLIVGGLFRQRLQEEREEWQARVAIRTRELAEERKKRLDETEQFYSSPEWNLLRNQVIREEGSVCHICGKRIQNKNDITVDHIRPRSKYPNLALDRQNLHVLCRRCNASKGANDLLDA